MIAKTATTPKATTTTQLQENALKDNPILL
jgi:hypothetical protein